MITKAKRSRRKPQPEQPLNVELTVQFRFGDAPEECVTVMDQRRVPMVNSVFHYRDRIMRQMGVLMVKAGMSQPKVVRELMPLLRMATPKRRKKQES